MGRAPCCEKIGLNRGPWTREEDLLLTQYINEHGEGAWRTLPKAAGLRRCGKSCRLRWINYLRPDIKHGNISEEEDQMIIKLHSLLGNRWSLIAARLPGRTDNEIKNHWNTHLKKKLRSMGIDPQSHCPIELQNGAGSSSSSGINYSNPRAPCFQDTLESLTLESRSPTTLPDLPIDQSGCSAFKKYNKSDKSASKDEDLEQLCSCESHGFSTEEHAEDLTAVSDAADSSPRDLAPSFSCELCPVTVYWDGKQDASTSSLLLNIMHSDVSWDVEILHPIDNLDQPNPASADLWGCN